jgi:hypothetical protein
MIVRRVGQEVLLITQQDHAILSGQLASAWGNPRFAGPQPREEVIEAVVRHDDGWAEWDQALPVDSGGNPIDFLHAPPSEAIQIWSNSISTAATLGPMSGIIVSTHFSRLAEWGIRDSWSAEERGDPTAQDFLDRQRNDRRKWRNRLDPKAREWVDYNTQVLRICDWISLVLCGVTEVGFRAAVIESPSSESETEFQMQGSEEEFTVKAWPFSHERFEFSIRCAVAPARTYSNSAELNAAIDSGSVRSIHVALRRSKRS